MILVTGANGFVGKAVCAALSQSGKRYVGAVRRVPEPEQFAVGEIGGTTDWSGALAGCTAVIHLAARVHVMSDTDADPLSRYREVNVDGTLNLARQALEAGVKRFVFVSSVKVNGEATPEHPFKASDTPAPQDPYGISKAEAEQALARLAAETGLEVVVVRPPLVYGPGVKANFLNLIRLVRRGLPLPFGVRAGYRSMVALDNLVDLLIVCTEHPNAVGQIFMVSDGVDLTVRDLVEYIGNAMKKKPTLLPIPVGLMRMAAAMLGRAGIADRLFGSLRVDIQATRERLKWSPVVTPEAAIRQTVEDYLKVDVR